MWPGICTSSLPRSGAFLEVEVSQVGPGQNDALVQLRESGYAVAGPEYPRIHDNELHRSFR